MTAAQQKEIDIAKKKGIDTSLFNDPHFSAKQMHEIRMGLEEGIDASIYAYPHYELEKMQTYRMVLGTNLYFGTDIPVESLFNDLNAKECTALYKLIFDDYTGRGWQPRFDLHNPIERETLKQRAINLVSEPNRNTNTNIER